jgi:hypothetical protein
VEWFVLTGSFQSAPVAYIERNSFISSEVSPTSEMFQISMRIDHSRPRAGFGAGSSKAASAELAGCVEGNARRSSGESWLSKGVNKVRIL